MPGKIDSLQTRKGKLEIPEAEGILGVFCVHLRVKNERQKSWESKNKITEGTQLSKVQIFDVEFEVHLVSLCDAKRQPICRFLHAIGGRVRLPFCCLINN
jgi:hypothetical protein